jgi:hypothetical protein
MREMQEKAYRAELGEHRDRQDGHDWQHGAKLGAPLIALKQDPHGSLHSRGFQLHFRVSMSEPDMKAEA